MKLTTLYKTAKSGAIQVMDIETINNTFIVTWGQKDGKMQTRLTTCKGKNVGKSNETTDNQQATAEAKAYWEKKKKANYSTDKTAPVLVHLPQKVQTYSKHINKVQFPCYESPKLNGVNGTYKWVDNTLELRSRGGELYPLIDQHLEDIKKIMEDLETDELNGEIYIHGEHLQDITSAVKKYNELTPRLEFRIFDLPGFTCTYEKRVLLLRSIKDTTFIKVVPIGIAWDHRELDALHNTYVWEGYEGLIVRNAKGKYVHNERSNDVFKLKKALDAEFQVLDYKLDKSEHAVFKCIVDPLKPITTENTFYVKLKGTAAERLAMAAEADTYISKWLKIEYEMLSDIGKPLKPVGIMFRECDADGNPTE